MNVLNLATLEATSCAVVLFNLFSLKKIGLVVNSKYFWWNHFISRKEAASGEKCRLETGFDGKQFLMRLFLAEAIKITWSARAMFAPRLLEKVRDRGNRSGVFAFKFERERERDGERMLPPPFSNYEERWSCFSLCLVYAKCRKSNLLRTATVGQLFLLFNDYYVHWCRSVKLLHFFSSSLVPWYIYSKDFKEAHSFIDSIKTHKRRGSIVASHPAARVWLPAFPKIIQRKNYQCYWG